MVVGFYNYIDLWNQCLSPLTLWVRIPLRRSVLDTTLYDKICQWLATVLWFSPRTPVSSTNKTDCHDITGVLLKVALNTITLTLSIHKSIIVHQKFKLFCKIVLLKVWKKILIPCNTDPCRCSCLIKRWIYFLIKLV